jgi:hypothetical protein
MENDNLPNEIFEDGQSHCKEAHFRPFKAFFVTITYAVFYLDKRIGHFQLWRYHRPWIGPTLLAKTVLGRTFWVLWLVSPGEPIQNRF